MKLSKLKHTLLRLSPEEKITLVTGIFILISTFLPWYSVKFINQNSMTLSGFSGDLGVIGFIVFLFTALSIGFLVTSYFKIGLPLFGYKKEQLTTFFLGESAFLLLLTIAIYTKRSFEYSNAEIRFGLYIALASAFIGTFATYSQMQKKQKKDVEAFFSHEEAEEAEMQSEPNLEAEYPPIKNMEPKVKEESIKPAHQEKFFYEEPVTEANEEEIIEDEMAEDVEIEEPKPDEEIVEAEPEIAEAETSDETTQSDETEPADQGSYFAREAGIKVDMESVRRVDNESAKEEPELNPVASRMEEISSSESEKKKSDSDNTDFYEDF